jgi:hypothetical protein
LRDRGLNSLTIRDIAGDGQRLRTRLLDLSGDLLAALWIDIGEHHSRAIFGQA